MTMNLPCATRSLGLILLGLLAACGGGGSAGGSNNAGGVPDAPDALLAPTQAQAESLVRLAEQRTRDLRLAAGLTGTPTGSARTQPSAWRPGRASIQAVQDLSSSLCSNGRLTVDVADELIARFEADPNAQLRAGDRLVMTATACRIQAPLELGEVTLGSFGVGSLVDGRFSLLLQQRSGADFLFALTYTAFTYTPPGSISFDPLDAVLRFGRQGGASVYELDLEDARVLQAPVLTTAGDVVMVDSARLRAPLPAAGYADLAYSQWRLDTTTLRASAGSVQVQGAGGTLAVIGAGETGYTVDIGSAAQTTRFRVAR